MVVCVCYVVKVTEPCRVTSSGSSAGLEQERTSSSCLPAGFTQHNRTKAGGFFSPFFILIKHGPRRTWLGEGLGVRRGGSGRRLTGQELDAAGGDAGPTRRKGHADGGDVCVCVCERVWRRSEAAAEVHDKEEEQKVGGRGGRSPVASCIN